MNAQTKFASPERTGSNGISREKEHIARQELFVNVLDAFPDMVLILNENRQISYCNRQVLSLLGCALREALGKRPGEAFGCIHSCVEPWGCGTSQFCRECGAVNSILRAQKGEPNYSECRMIIGPEPKEGYLTLRVWSTPISIGGENFTVFSIKDIADEKRRELLQRMFFHDMLNNATLLLSHTYNVVDEIIPADRTVVKKIHNIAEAIVEDIKEARDLLAAEEGVLAVTEESFKVCAFLDDIVKRFAGSKLAEDCSITLDCRASDEETLKTDKVLLSRALSNLIKNALEATDKSGSVGVVYEKEDGTHRFSIYNPGVIPREVQHQIFQKAFSTKGKGRGIGTYSAKFITETYLNGRVWFESTPEKGTIFYVELK